jgi:PAS domain S-box-containing protein
VLLEKREGTITHSNPAAETMLGYTKEECIGNKLQDIGVSLDRSDFQTITQTLHKNGIINFNDVPVKTKSGQYIDTDIYMVDRARLIQCNIRDITKHKRTETEVVKLNEDLAMRNLELEEVNSDLESFIYSISHDLRAPIRHMSSFARFLLEDYAGKLDDQGKDYLKRINKGSDKMCKLVNDLLDLSRLSRQELSRTEVDMSALAASMVSGLREADSGRSVEISIEDGINASADQPLMEIVLSNLIGNAWKFTSKISKARIEFGTIEKGGKTVYYVRDNGAGFNFKYATKMFQPFHRLHSDEDFEGTGIGLAIVERVIRRHGGKVWAEGKVGKGASVCFTLG